MNQYVSIDYEQRLRLDRETGSFYRDYRSITDFFSKYLVELVQLRLSDDKEGFRKLADYLFWENFRFINRLAKLSFRYGQKKRDLVGLMNLRAKFGDAVLNFELGYLGEGHGEV